MIPILELRGGLLAAGPAILDIPMWQAIPICVIGNLLPIPFILLLITKIFDWMKGTKKLKPIVEKLEKKALSKSDQIEKYEFWGLVIFVGIPLPRNGCVDGRADRGASRNQVPQSVSGDRDRSLPRSVYHDCTVIWIPWSSVRLGGTECISDGRGDVSMLMKNSEEKRNTAWRTVMTVSSVLIIIVAVFFVIKLFTANPVEGTWVSERGRCHPGDR